MTDEANQTSADEPERIIEHGWQKPTQPPEMRLTGLPPAEPRPIPSAPASSPNEKES